jgi:hypothetical protein
MGFYIENGREPVKVSLHDHYSFLERENAIYTTLTQQ